VLKPTARKSTQVFCRRAATMPIPIPNGTIKRKARAPFRAVIGQLSRMMLITVWFWYWYERPKSMCVTFRRYLTYWMPRGWSSPLLRVQVGDHGG